METRHSIRPEQNIATVLGAALGGLLVSAALVAALCIWSTGAWGAESVKDEYAEEIWQRSYQAAAKESILNRSAAPLSGLRATSQEQGQPKNQSAWDPKRLARIETHQDLIDHYSRQVDLDADLVKAVIYVESGGDPLALSRQGAAGLMQLMPATATQLGAVDRFDAETNIEAGARYLRSLLDRYHSVEVALWAYNAGPESVRLGRLPLQTQEYVPQVLRLRRDLKARQLNLRVGQ